MLKILFFTANPARSGQLRVDAEVRSLRDGLGVHAGSVDLQPRGAVRPEDLHRDMDEVDPHIVHFSGHGAHGGDLLLETTEGGAHKTDAEAIADLFRVRRHRVRLAVINACHSEPLAERIAAHVDCAVGMARTIRDSVAITFSATLYRELAAGRSVQEAFDCARNAIQLGNPADAELVQLHARPGVDPAGVVLHQPSLYRPTARPGILLHLDLVSENALSEDEILAQLPQAGSIHRLRATDFGAQRTPHGPGTHFTGAAAAITRMVNEARHRVAAGQSPRFYIAGTGPLPLFVHLGLELSRWADDVVLIHRRDGHAWDLHHLQGDPAPSSGPFFEVRRGLSEGAEPVESTGRLVVYVSTSHPHRKEQTRAFLDERGERIAGFVELCARAHGGRLLHAGNVAQAARELEALQRQLIAHYPNHRGIALFFAGPTTLAFLLGRALNAHLLQGDVWVPYYHQGTYQDALRLPFRAPTRRPVSTDPAHVQKRDRILTALRDAVTDLKRKLGRQHIPPALGDIEANALLDRLSGIEVSLEPQGEAFELRDAERMMTFGEGLLDALREQDTEQRRRVGRCLLLHELYHVDQNLSTDRHHDVGRAGVALEEIDHRADALAVETLARLDIQRGGDDALEQAREIAKGYVEAVLLGMEVFDRAEQGDRLDRLPERRLRRYLAWHLQRARALTVRRPEDIEVLFRERLVAELAPLRGHLDERFEKVVDGALDGTELFVALGGRLLRTSRRTGFDPAAIVDAVRRFDWGALEAAMRVFREEHRQVLVPWVP